MVAQEANLPDLRSEYPLPKERTEEYQRDGHILLREVASVEEVAAYRDAIVDAAERHSTEKRLLEERNTYGKAFLQVPNLWYRDEAVKRFVLAPRFAQVAAELMGVEGVRIYHDQALFKEPGGGPTPWHQDQHYWPLDTDNTITMWMPLVDADSDRGTMRFASGSQEQGYLGDLPISDESEEAFQNFIEEHGMSVTESAVMSAGDATYHSGWTLHSAPGNSSETTREVMTVIYFADGAHAIEPDNTGRRNDLKEWLASAEPGELAASSLNPVAYSEGKEGRN